MHGSDMTPPVQMGSGTEVFDAGSIELTGVVEFGVPVV